MPPTAPSPLLDRLGLHRPELRAWALYDVANSAWMTTILQVFTLFFVRVAASDLDPDVARARFAFATSFSVILVGLTGPLLGAIADYRRRKKSFLAVFLAAGVVATASMFFIQPGGWRFALVMFSIGNICVMATLAFYNALLPGIASEHEVDRVSTAGYAIGYLGGGVLFAVNALMMADPLRFGLADAGVAARVAFVSVAVWWVLFSIPMFRRVPEPLLPVAADVRGSALRVAARRVAKTVRELRQHRDAGLLLLSFLVYNDAINTIIRMAVAFGDEVGISTSALIGALVMVQFVGVPFAFAFGALAGRIGAKPALFVALAIYSVIAVYAFALHTATQFFVLAFLVGTVQGGAQALGRSLFASMIPKHKAGELFGIFGVFDRFGGALGSLAFGIVLALTGSSRPAILMLVLFFAAGAWLLAKVDVARGRRRAREDEARFEAAGVS
jgi:UMF1 family MFS transporter